MALMTWAVLDAYPPVARSRVALDGHDDGLGVLYVNHERWSVRELRFDDTR
jgi:hypothetical protein